jgi:hypothetical protein
MFPESSLLEVTSDMGRGLKAIWSSVRTVEGQRVLWCDPLNAARLGPEYWSGCKFGPVPFYT